MRVIGGIYGSRTLRGPGDRKLRPTSDRLRETLFNMLGAAVEGAVFVDVFAGTGAVGIEALSRGASRVVFIESHRGTAALIRRNLESLQIREGASVLLLDALRGLRQLAAGGTRADIVFLDPPYAACDICCDALRWLGETDLLNPGGTAVAEHSSRRSLPARFGRLARVRERIQGDAALSFYRQVSAAAHGETS